MPHIRAQTSDDAWFGQGFCHGQDRLWQLDLYRRFASGRLAEIAGPEGLPSDRFLRTLGLRRVALREEAALERPARASALEAYCGRGQCRRRPRGRCRPSSSSSDSSSSPGAPPTP